MCVRARTRETHTLRASVKSNSAFLFFFHSLSVFVTNKICVQNRCEYVSYVFERLRWRRFVAHCQHHHCHVIGVYCTHHIYCRHRSSQVCDSDGLFPPFFDFASFSFLPFAFTFCMIDFGSFRIASKRRQIQIKQLFVISMREKRNETINTPNEY